MSTPKKRHQAGASRFRNSMVDAVGLLFVMIFSALFFYYRGIWILEQEVRSSFTQMATFAVQQFDGDEVKKLHDSLEPNAPYYREAVRRLKNIRSVSSRIRFAYIMAKTDDPSNFVFLADADEFATPEDLDEDGDGVVSEDEEPSLIGDLYDVSEIPPMRDGTVFVEPTMDAEPTTDQWGTVISAYAPIVDHDGNTVAMMGIDVEADEFALYNTSIFTRTYLYFALAGIAFITLYIFVQMRGGHVDE